MDNAAPFLTSLHTLIIYTQSLRTLWADKNADAVRCIAWSLTQPHPALLVHPCVCVDACVEVFVVVWAARWGSSHRPIWPAFDPRKDGADGRKEGQEEFNMLLGEQ